ncbi:hypothetical protein [Bradyrhizobium sp. USDA 313]|uniref:hypothetical protein n=1 Tax=Bradyrhizobium sp. USDA 313 TaxID=3156307 RepID=UPI0035110B16
MTVKTASPGTSRHLPKSASRINEERPTQHVIVEDTNETADDGRDLAHGEGGSIDLPTQPGDLAKDD